MPDLPDLTSTEPRALSAFLDRELNLGLPLWTVAYDREAGHTVQDILNRPYADAVRAAERGTRQEAARFAQIEAETGTPPPVCPRQWRVELHRHATKSVLTADGADAVVEALGERRFQCSRFYNPGLATPGLRHETRFHGNWPSAPRGMGNGETDVVATVRAAVDLLWPDASPEARALLIPNAATDA